MEIRFRENCRDFLGRLVLPSRCLVCGNESDCGSPLCLSCHESFLLARSASLSVQGKIPGRCDRCGRPLVSAKECCIECRESAALSSIDRIMPLFPYTAEGQSLLTSWKVMGRRGLTELFAECLALAIARTPGMAVIPVPPRPGKIRERGWDQIEDISRCLERRFGITVSRCLERRSSLQQKKLGKLARTVNMRGAMVYSGAHPAPFSAIVIDDLMTTGATLDACSDALKIAGCGKVCGLTLFFD